MRQKCLIKNHTEEIEWNKWKVKFRTHSVEMPTLYTSCLETLEVQTKITTACILNPYLNTIQKQPRFIRLIFYFSLNMYNCVSFSLQIQCCAGKCPENMITKGFLTFPYFICYFAFFLFFSSIFAICWLAMHSFFIF